MLQPTRVAEAFAAETETGRIREMFARYRAAYGLRAGAGAARRAASPLTELQARELLFGIALCVRSCAPPRRAFLLAPTFIDPACRNHWGFGENGVALPLPWGCRAPGMPFPAGGSWFAWRTDGRFRYINTPDPARLDVEALRRCFGGTLGLGMFVMDLRDLETRIAPLVAGLGDGADPRLADVRGTA